MDKEEIKKAFNNLESDEKVLLLVDLYFTFFQYEKDKFLKLIED